MRIPEKLLCDLCKTELDPSKVHARLQYPLDEQDRALVANSLPCQHTGILAVFVPQIPNAWVFEFCQGCVDGFMPMLSDLKAECIKRMLDDHRVRSEPRHSGGNRG